MWEYLDINFCSKERENEWRSPPVLSLWSCSNIAATSWWNYSNYEMILLWAGHLLRLGNSVFLWQRTQRECKKHLWQILRFYKLKKKNYIYMAYTYSLMRFHTYKINDRSLSFSHTRVYSTYVNWQNPHTEADTEPTCRWCLSCRTDRSCAALLTAGPGPLPSPAKHTHTIFTRRPLPQTIHTHYKKERKIIKKSNDYLKEWIRIAYTQK